MGLGEGGDVTPDGGIFPITGRSLYGIRRRGRCNT